MTEQRTYADVILSNKRRTTRREQFLTERDRVIPRATVEALVALHYPKAGRGRRPLPMRTLLRIHFLQRWFNQSDPQAADMLHDSESTRRFARIDLLSDTVPDETTICRFRHLPEAHQRTARMFDAVKALLEERKPMLKAGTIVDATIIGAPSATKNARQTRDPEMRQTKKGNPWYFGMKMHVGTDRRGLIHSITTTHAAAADITQLPHLLDGQETTLHGDRAYDKADDNDVGAQRRALPRQQERQADGVLGLDQSCPLARTRDGRAPVSHHQAAVGLHESPVSGAGEEHRACVRARDARQPVPRAAPLGAAGHVVSARAPRSAETGRFCPGNGALRAIRPLPGGSIGARLRRSVPRDPRFCT
jgi:IS5 family transposase